MLKRILILTLALFIRLTISAQPLRSADSYFNYGKKLKDEGKLAEAIDAFMKATILDKDFDSAYIEWSGVYQRLNQVDDAIGVLKNAIKVNPKMTGSLGTLGNLYRDNKSSFDSALIYYSAVAALDSTNKKNFYDMAWCYNAKGEFEKAIPFTEKALAIDKNYKIAYNEMGHSYHAMKKYDEGIAMFKKYIAISTCDLPLYYCGLCYLELAQYDNVQKMIDDLRKMGSKLNESLTKRLEMKKNPKPAQ